MFLNRELSWLEFNQRVLDEVQRDDLPLLERLKFLAISASNMEEFFQVRVGSLVMAKRSGKNSKDNAGLTTTQQLITIRERVEKMTAIQYTLLNQKLLPTLAKNNIHLTSTTQLSPAQEKQIADTFTNTIHPLLTPLAYHHTDADTDADLKDPESSSPLILPSLQLIIALSLQDPQNHSTRYVFVPIPENTSRFLSIHPADNSHLFILAEDLITQHLHQLFPGENITASTTFRLIRNSDIAVHEEDSVDLAGEMEEVLTARRFSDTIRLEVPADTPRDLLHIIRQASHITTNDIAKIDGPLALSDFINLAFLDGQDHLRHKPWNPQPSPSLQPAEPLFDTLSRQDILLYHPYESFEPVLRFLEEAAHDPDTLAIKQVLYRTAKNSRVVDALICAAENGKQVTALVELKARFDESRNLHRADELQRAGVQVVYGVRDLKTHAKVTLIVRNEDGRLKRYCHLGTGNYNEATSRLYTDVSYLTSHPAYGADASSFFNAVTGRSKLVRLQKLIPAPTHMKTRILELIQTETEIALTGEKARIYAKINSLQDPDIIQALIQAAHAGVKVNLNVRGICCLQQPLAKAGKNLRVISIIDRYLEHARIFSFHQAGEPELYIASADWMVRNLEKRVELMIPIEEPELKKRLLNALKSAFKDNTQAFTLQRNGTWKKIPPQKNQPPHQFQKHLQQLATEAAKNRAHEKASTFQPHRPNTNE